MTSPDDDLARLIRGAVDDLEPGNGLSAIHRRTRSGEDATGLRRSGIFNRWSAIGAVVAVAAVAGIVAVSAWPRDASDSDKPAASGQPSNNVSNAPSDVTIPVYFAGDTPDGARLYREFALVQPAERGVDAVRRVLEGATKDPDYRTLWPAGRAYGLESVRRTGDVIEVQMSNAPVVSMGLSPREARLALQQVVYTAQGALKAPGIPVRFVQADGSALGKVLGESVSSGIKAKPQNDVLALVNVTAPFEGQGIDKSITASGRANSFEATVQWQVLDGDEVVLDGFATASGNIDRLYPWETKVNVEKLEPGTYVFVARTDDPTAGEGPGPTEDTKTIVIR